MRKGFKITCGNCGFERFFDLEGIIKDKNHGWDNPAGLYIEKIDYETYQIQCKQCGNKYDI